VSAGEFTCYLCSKDGEPDSDGMNRIAIDVLPFDDSAAAVAFRVRGNLLATASGGIMTESDGLHR
jgi:hypothetical protein